MRRVAVGASVLLGCGIAWAGCTQTATTAQVRSLERSGRSAFLCIGDPNAPSPGRQLDGCFAPGEIPSRTNYGVPHVIALVTQTSRGEIAVVDVTSQTVIDADPSVPGFSFLPVGALPTDIVATPGSNASFVAVGDPNRPGIFALPSSMLPVPGAKKAFSLSSWPACAFPPSAIPGEILIVNDQTASPSDPGARRAHCDGTPGQEASPGTDLSGEIALFGRPKLVVTIPDRGELLILDAQDLLSMQPGTFDPCPVERRVVLQVDTTMTPPPGPGPDAGVDGSTLADAGMNGASDSGSADAGPDGPVCSGRFFPSSPASREPHPAALAYADDGRLFVSDDRASVIHVVDLRDPCAPSEKPPLLPFSAADPARAVVSSAIAVSPLTSDRKRFVYATDLKNNGSIMVFDVSQDSNERRPLLRPDRLSNPSEPPDRIAMGSPVESLTFAAHEVPLAEADPATGTRPRGMACDPTNATDPNRPPADFVTSGAGPRRLRGIFAFLALSNGQIAVIDVDDLDVNCRRPRYTDDVALGCEGTTVAESTFPAASQEHSCKIVERHRLRSFQFLTNATGAGRHAPAMLGFPLLYDKDGTVLTTDPTREETASRPRLLGPMFVPEEHDRAAWPLLASVSGSTVTPGPGGLWWEPTGAAAAPTNWVAFDLREPRNHQDQTWKVIYEGIIPWFVGRKGRLQCAAERSAIECEQGTDPSHFNLYDSSVSFCDGGAQGTDLAASMGIPSGDTFEIIDDLPHPDDPYWSTVAGICNRQQCERAFGTPVSPVFVNTDTIGGRDLVIEKSYQDHLELRASNTGGVPLGCCFPYPVSYTVRAGQHWIVTGQTTGFVHQLIPDPTATDSSAVACVQSCDEALQLRNGRVVGRPAVAGAEFPTYDDPRTFRNAQIRFVLWEPDPANCSPTMPCIVRDQFFSFSEVGGFIPMTIAISQTAVLPQSIRFVRGLQQLAIADPVGQGLLLFDLNRLQTTLTFY